MRWRSLQAAASSAKASPPSTGRDSVRRRIACRQRRAYASMSRSVRSSSTARPAGSFTAAPSARTDPGVVPVATVSGHSRLFSQALPPGGQAVSACLLALLHGDAAEAAAAALQHVGARFEVGVLVVEGA